MRNISAILRSGLISSMILGAGIIATAETAAALPAAPQLDYPSNGMNAGGTVIPFRWQQVDGAYNYYLQVATDAGFTNVIFGSWVGNYIGIDMSGFPDNGRTYYWRVAAYDGEEGPFSGTWFFVNGPSDIPDIPVLSSPANNSNAAGTTVQFRWNPADRASDYYLEVATDAGFTEIVYGEQVGNYIGIDMSGFPDNGRTYYWHVSAGNPLGSSNYSGTWSFVNGPSDIPDIPVLTSPLDNANVQGTTIEFRWEPAARANDYYFEVATDAGLCQYRIRPMDRQFYRYKPQRFRR